MTGESSYDDQLLMVSDLTVSNFTDLQTTFRLLAALSIKKNEVPGYTKLCTSLHFFYSGMLYFLLFQK